jgi:hypothetical protein
MESEKQSGEVEVSNWVLVLFGRIEVIVLCNEACSIWSGNESILVGGRRSFRFE